MFHCPHCDAVLVRRKAQQGLYWHCPGCTGRLVGMGPLKNTLPRPLFNAIWGRVREREGSVGRPCPGCNHSMLEVAPEYEARLPLLDVCRRCHMTWFDPDEFQVLPKLDAEPAKQKGRAKQAWATLQVFEDRKPEQGFTARQDGYDWWQYLPGILFWPVEYSGHEVYTPPWTTRVLCLLVFGISVAAMAAGLPGVVSEWGLLPAELGRHTGLTFITSFFLHGGLLHLLGNFYFLYVFGDNVEEFLGPAPYLLLIFSATLVGDLLHVAFDPRGSTPLVGASGGISGLLAFYALKFPHVRISFLVGWFLVIFRWFQIPAFWAFVFWMALQALGIYHQVAGVSNVSAMAHVGGAATGFVFWLVYKNK